MTITKLRLGTPSALLRDWYARLARLGLSPLTTWTHATLWDGMPTADWNRVQAAMAKRWRKAQTWAAFVAKREAA